MFVGKLFIPRFTSKRFAPHFVGKLLFHDLPASNVLHVLLSSCSCTIYRQAVCSIFCWQAVISWFTRKRCALFCWQAVHCMIYWQACKALHFFACKQCTSCLAWEEEHSMYCQSVKPSMFFIVSIFLHVFLTTIHYCMFCKIVLSSRMQRPSTLLKRSIQFFQTTLHSRFLYTLGSSFCWTLCVLWSFIMTLSTFFLYQSTVFPISLACLVPLVWSLAMLWYSNSVFALILLIFNVNFNQLSRCLAPTNRVPSFWSCPVTTSVAITLSLYALILLHFDVNLLLLTLPLVLRSTLVPSLRWFRPVLVLSRDKPPIKSPFLSRTAVIASRGLSFVAISMVFCTSKVFQFQAAKGKVFRKKFFLQYFFFFFVG